jgi:hypothetical protein
MMNDIAMIQRQNKTFICSVVFLDIANYSTRMVVEQSNLKQRLNESIAEAIKDVAVNDRIILDTGDGAAISFLGDPEDALFVAMTLRDFLAGDPETSRPPLPVRIGINLGPVKLVKDLNEQSNLIGDGINVAQRVMSFAQPGQILVSRSFYDVVSCLSDEYARLFHYLGMKSDKHVREHQVYAVEKPGPVVVPTAAPAPGTTPGRPPTIQESITALKAMKASLKSVSRPGMAKSVAKAKKEIRKGWLIYATIPVAIGLVVAAVFLFRKPRPSVQAPSANNIDSNVAQGFKDIGVGIEKILSGKPDSSTPSKKEPEKPKQQVEIIRQKTEPPRKPPEVQKTAPPKETAFPTPEPAKTSAAQTFILIRAVSGCQVFIDNGLGGYTQEGVTKIPVQPGNHKIQILSPAGQSYKEDIDLKRGETREIKTPFR